jgi:hypothetical protein
MSKSGKLAAIEAVAGYFSAPWEKGGGESPGAGRVDLPAG